MSFASELPSTDSGSFYAENDTISVAYIFQGSSIKIEIENKTDQLHFIDWSRSSMIFNDQSIPFTTGMSKIEGKGNTYQNLSGISNSNFEGTISESLTRSYIPPMSRIGHEFSALTIDFQKNLKKSFAFESMLIPAHSKKFTFDESNTLHKIRSYLAIGTEDATQIEAIQHNFWMSNLVETGEGRLKLKGNQLQVSKQTTTGMVTNSLATAMILAASDTEE